MIIKLIKVENDNTMKIERNEQKKSKMTVDSLTQHQLSFAHTILTETRKTEWKNESGSK